MKINEISKEFPVTVYGNLEKYNETVSKARCRIFYKGANRNGTFISEEFAEKLISSLAYAPVKGIYDEYNEDYTDHGEERTEGRIYGVVPETHNFAWETHLDEDGIERVYACTDVLLFTGIYKEAGEIAGKSQSMELYEPSIDGYFQMINGKKYFTFTEGCFLGLQVLGEEVEPCFEGAAFFQLVDKLQNVFEQIKSLENASKDSAEGGNTMPNVSFKLSDSEKYELIWSNLNTNFNEENNWTVEYAICDVYDDYALVYGYEDNAYYRVYYTKEEEGLAISEKKRCYIVDVTETEKSTLDTIQALNGGSFELLDQNIQAKDEKISEYEQKKEEYELSISTLESEKEELTNSLSTLSNEYTALKEETEALQTYKLDKENEEKMAVINKYSAQLDEELIKQYKEKVSEFTKTDLEKELAFELVQSKPSIFTVQGQSNLIPKDNGNSDSLDAILEKYRK